MNRGVAKTSLRLVQSQLDDSQGSNCEHVIASATWRKLAAEDAVWVRRFSEFWQVGRTASRHLHLPARSSHRASPASDLP